MRNGKIKKDLFVIFAPSSWVHLRCDELQRTLPRTHFGQYLGWVENCKIDYFHVAISKAVGVGLADLGYCN